VGISFPPTEAHLLLEGEDLQSKQSSKKKKTKEGERDGWDSGRRKKMGRLVWGLAWTKRGGLGHSQEAVYAGLGGRFERVQVKEK